MSYTVKLYAPEELPDGRWKVRITGLFNPAEEQSGNYSRVCETRDEAYKAWEQARFLMRKAMVEERADWERVS